MSSKNQGSVLLVIIFFAALLVAGTLAYFAFINTSAQDHLDQSVNQARKAVFPTQAQQLTQVDSNSSTEVPTQRNNSIYYKSENLGLRFRYSPEYGSYGDIPKTMEVGNKIFLNYRNPDRDDDNVGGWIEVFETTDGMSVSEDIEKRFLTIYGYEHCSVKERENYSESNITYPKGSDFRLVTIEFKDSSLPYEQGELARALCPAEYVTANAVNFFAYDINNPKRYIYYSIGQEAAWPASLNSYESGGDGLSWMQTIEFTD